jgi:peptide/nickel transport system ATP-binding protein
VSSNGADPLLDVEDLVVAYPIARGLTSAALRRPERRVLAVDGITFGVDRGELVALVGESGCGKTTTAQAVLRLVEATSGRVSFDGRDITELPNRALRPLRRSMQIIYQDPYESLDPRMTVRDAVEEPMLIHGLGGSRAARRELVREAVARVELTPPDLFLERYPHELSGGQRQRVAIAASLVLEPELLVADEPVSMLDVSVRAGVLNLLDRLRQDGLGILMITHDLSTAARYADRIAVMYLGRIVEIGPAPEIVENPQHPYTKALLSVVPRRDPRDRKRPQVLTGEAPDATRIPSGCRFHPRCPVAIEECRAHDPELLRPRNAVSPDHRAACILACLGRSGADQPTRRPEARARSCARSAVGALNGPGVFAGGFASKGSSGRWMSRHSRQRKEPTHKRVSSIGPPHARHTFPPARAEGSSVQFAMPQSVPLAASSKLSGSLRNSYPLIE